MTRARLGLAPALLPALLLAGCASSPTRFWTIDPVAVPAATAPRAIAPVQIAAVHLPLALDRLEVVRHDRTDRMRVLDFDRWSAPPGSLIRTALTQDLAARLPAGSVVFPTAPIPPGTRRLVVDVLALQADGDGYTMQLAWSRLPSAAGQQLRLHAAGTPDVAGQTHAIALMVDQLAAAIASSL